MEFPHVIANCVSHQRLGCLICDVRCALHYNIGYSELCCSDSFSGLPKMWDTSLESTFCHTYPPIAWNWNHLQIGSNHTAGKMHHVFELPGIFTHYTDQLDACHSPRYRNCSVQLDIFVLCGQWWQQRHKFPVTYNACCGNRTDCKSCRGYYPLKQVNLISKNFPRMWIILLL